MQSRPSESELAAALSALEGMLGDRLSRNAAVRAQHANTLTWIANQPPDAVAWPVSRDEVVEVVRIAARHRVPLIPYGTGTSLEGHVNAPLGGISIDMSRMDRILAVRADDQDCRVETGVTRAALAIALRDTGLFFPVDPGAEQATLGGMAATRASGTTTVRYGSMRDNVLGLTAVLADGSVIEAGGRARKSAAGYDLTRLLVGSEGTLGIITDLTLRLYPVPGAVAVVTASFPDVAAAAGAAIAIASSSLGAARIELLDAAMIGATNRHAGTTLPEAPTLFVELHAGSTGAADDMAAVATAYAADYGSTEGASAIQADARSALWRARHEAFWAVRTAWPGRVAIATDVCVPIGGLADCIAATQADAAAEGFVAPIVGHVGDGNFHVILMVDPGSEDERWKVERFLDRLVARALDMDGTCSGEHGIGQGKIKHLAREAASAIATMRRIKTALDPLGILNPGKVLASPDVDPAT